MSDADWEGLLVFESDRARPDYLDASDEVWLAELRSDYVAAVGATRAELDECLGFRADLADHAKLRAARTVLDRVFPTRCQSALSPRAARAAAFRASAATGDRGEALRIAASELGSSADELEAALFADVPANRIVTAPEELPPLSELAQRTNRVLLSHLLKRAERLRITVPGDGAALLRDSKHRGLIAALHAASVVFPGGASAANTNASERSTVWVAGPQQLERHRVAYVRALASLIDALREQPGFVAELRLSVRGQRTAHDVPAHATATEWEPTGDDVSVLLRDGDPIFPSEQRAPRSATPLRRVLRGLRQLVRRGGVPGWRVHEPTQPLRVRDASGIALAPDIELRHRSGRRAWVELLGYWTPASLEQAAQHAHAHAFAPPGRYLLCADTERCCAKRIPRALGASTLLYTKSLEPGRILEALG